MDKELLLYIIKPYFWGGGAGFEFNLLLHIYEQKPFPWPLKKLGYTTCYYLHSIACSPAEV